MLTDSLPRRNRLRIAICGSLTGAEAERAAAALLRLPHDAEISRHPARRAEWPQLAGQADLCIVFQAWPDEFPVAVARAVVAECSAARLIVCQGAWCASAGRTRKVWPKAVCVPVEELAARLEFEIAVLNGRRTPLPATAALDEIFAATYAMDAPGAAELHAIDSSSAAHRRFRD